ncbi:uncharacterized protein LOC141525904 [Cotesia typhae]|uniref:uncharacterized protein LOC141525904 n=1 Tax=Cotesia typhae TaxID=2053667 RepID=UPI003D688135
MESENKKAYYGDKFEGRRIIDLRLLAEKLWCTFCNDALSLRFLIKEEFLGLVSIFHVRCQKCQEVYKFATSKSYKIENDPNIRYSANGKIAIGLLASGMGVSQLNTILASLNVPTLYHTLFKRYEREVGVMIEKVAHDSCQKNLQIEKAMTLQKKRYSNMYNNCLNLILMTYFVE